MSREGAGREVCDGEAKKRIELREAKRVIRQHEHKREGRIRHDENFLYRVESGACMTHMQRIVNDRVSPDLIDEIQNGMGRTASSACRCGTMRSGMCGGTKTRSTSPGMHLHTSRD